MLKCLKKKKIILLGSLICLLSLGISFGVFTITYYVSTPFPYYILLLITAFLNALLAYVTGDIKIVLYKRKTGEINPVVPDEIIDSANELRAPFALALIGILIVLLGFFLTYLFSGSWPFLS